MHGTSIAIVALSEDGSAAATSDTTGMIRLWPTLDGTQEPFVVTGPIPTALAVARDHDRDFVIAAIDQARMLTVLRVGSDGRMLGKAQLQDDEQVLQVEATPQGFLTLRGDQSIELVTFDGKHGNRLPPSARVVSIMYRNNRALVLTRADTKIKGRWIDFVAGARWGEETPELDFLVGHAALAPDHKHLTAVANDKLVAIDLATGMATAFTGKGDPLGYIDDTTVACSDETGVAFLDDRGKRIGHVDLGFAADDTPLAVAQGHVVTASGEALGIVDATKVKYLGYQIDVPSRIRSAPVGLALSGNDTRWVVDKQFRLQRSFSVPHDEYTEVFDALPLTDKLTVALEGIDDGRWLTTVGSGKLFVGVRDDAIHFEPATRLLGAAASGQSVLIRVDESGKIGAPMTLGTSTSPLAQYLVDTTEDPDRIYLLDPALANGLVALVVHDHRIHEIHGDDLKPGALKARRSYAFAGGIVTVDRAGRIYTREPGTKNLVIHTGDRTAVLPGTANAARIVPNADGTLVAIHGTSLTLFRNDGTQVWTVPANDITALTWYDGALVAAAQGVVRIDLATGAYAERQCGWRFGLYAKPPATNDGHRLVCDV
jgi:hypothetical protein